MDERDIIIDRSAGGRKRSRFSGGVASQFQVALGLLGVLACLLLVFGVGFLFGLWYQANEPIMTHDDAVTLAEEQLRQTDLPPSSQPEMTFYSTLTTPDASETPPPAEAPQGSDSEPLGQTPEPLLPDARLDVPEGQGPPNGVVETKVTGIQPEAPVTEVPLASEPTESTPPVTQTPETPARPAQAETPPTVPDSEYYSVQVGSFRLAEQAQHLKQQLVDKGYAARTQLTMVPGKGAWYRVRVGKFGAREEADQTAQRLRSQERMDVLVTKESS